MQLAVSWQVFEITKSPLALGLIGIAEFAPYLLVSLIGGWTADRYQRKRIMLICIAGISLCSLALALINTLHFNTQGSTSILYYLYGILGLTAIFRGFYLPASFSIMARLVPRNLYPKSSAWNSAFFQIASSLGPAFGGFSYSFLGAGKTHSINCILLLCSFLLVAWMQVAKRPSPEKTNRKNFLKDIYSGLQFVLRQKALAGGMFLDLFAVLFGGAVALLPIFAEEILHVGSVGLGILRASPAVGALFASLLLARHPLLEGTGKKLLLSVSGFGFCMILFAFSKNMYLSCFLLLVSGALDSVSVVIRATMIQLIPPDSIRGKAASVNSIFISASNELGAFESGITANWLGTIPSVWMGGLLTQVVIISIILFFPELYRLDMKEQLDSMQS